MLFLHVIHHELVCAEVQTALFALDAFFLVLQEMLHELLSSVRGRAFVRGQREYLEAARALQLVRAVMCLLKVVNEVSVERTPKSTHLRVRGKAIVICTSHGLGDKDLSWVSYLACVGHFRLVMRVTHVVND